MPRSSGRLALHETTLPSGGLESTWLELVDGELGLRAGDAPSTPVPEHVLAAIMRRYGRPLAAPAHDGCQDELVLASGARLWRLRHLARYDVVAKDYLVYQASGEEPLAELATAVSAALWFIVGRLGRG